MEDQEWGLEALHPSSEARDWSTVSSLRLLSKSIIKIENSRGKASRVCGKHNVLCFLECAEDLEPKTPLSSIADMWIFQVVTLFNIYYFISQANQLIVGKHFILCSSMISK